MHRCIERFYLPLNLILFLWACNISLSLHVVTPARTVDDAEFVLYQVSINHTVLWLARRGCPGSLEKEDLPGVQMKGGVGLEHLQRCSAPGNK